MWWSLAEERTIVRNWQLCKNSWRLRKSRSQKRKKVLLRIPVNVTEASDQQQKLLVQQITTLLA